MRTRMTLLGLFLQCALCACGAAQQPVRVACDGSPVGLPAVDSTRLIADLAALADDSMEGRGLGTRGGARARTFVLERLQAIGLDTLATGALEPFSSATGGTAGGVNVVALVRGRSRPGRIILVTAHYDHLGVQQGEVYNGADDNASGTAAMIAIATWFHQHPPDNTVMFVALDGEEQGLLGAAAFVRDHLVVADSVIINVNLDMVSRSARQQLFVVGPKRYPALLPYLARAACSVSVALMLGHDQGWPTSEDWTLQSDQAVFQGIGIPFVYFGVEDHPDYHRPTDDVSRIYPGFFVATTRAIALFVALVDKSPAAAESARAVSP